jgi:hypothetical protein
MDVSLKSELQAIKSFETRPILKRVYELETILASLRQQFVDGMISKEKTLDLTGSQVDKLINEVESADIIMLNNQRNLKQTKECLLNCLELTQIRNRQNRIKHLLENVITPISLIVSKLRSQINVHGDINQAIDGILDIHQSVSCLNHDHIKSLLNKELQNKTNIIFLKIQDSIKANQILSDEFNDLIDFKHLSSYLDRLRIIIPSVSVAIKVVLNEFCACLDGVSRNSLLAVNEDPANKATIILSMLEFFEFLLKRFHIVIPPGEVKQLIYPQFMDKMVRETMKIVNGYEFVNDSISNVACIYSFVTRINKEISSNSQIPVDGFARFVNFHVTEQCTRKLKVVEFHRLLEISDSFPEYSETVIATTESLFRSLISQTVYKCGISTSQVSSDIYDAHEKWLLKIKYHAVPLVVDSAAFAIVSRSKLIQKRIKKVKKLSEMDVEKFTATMKEMHQQALALITEKLLYDLWSDLLTMWSTDLLESKEDSKATVRFLKEAGRIMGGIDLNREILFRAGGTVMASQAMETIGLVPDNNSHSISVAIDLCKKTYPAEQEWEIVQEFERILSKSNVELEEALNWCTNHMMLIPLRLQAVIFSKKFDEEDAHLGYDKLEAIAIQIVTS